MMMMMMICWGGAVWWKVMIKRKGVNNEKGAVQRDYNDDFMQGKKEAHPRPKTRNEIRHDDVPKTKKHRTFFSFFKASPFPTAVVEARKRFFERTVMHAVKEERVSHKARSKEGKGIHNSQRTTTGITDTQPHI